MPAGPGNHPGPLACRISDDSFALIELIMVRQILKIAPSGIRVQLDTPIYSAPS
jgi:hypothetical protein